MSMYMRVTKFLCMTSLNSNKFCLKKLNQSQLDEHQLLVILIVSVIGKGYFSFQSQRKAMPKIVQITTQTIALISYASNSSSQASTVCEP